MPEKSPQSIHLTASAKTVEEASRVLPLAVATVVCFLAAVTLGYGSWYFFGSHRWQKNSPDFEYTITNIDGSNTAPKNEVVETPASSPSSQQATPAPATETNIETVKPENVVEIAGGEITLGGGDTGRPLKRALVDDFYLAETEVTNEQYAEFVKATNHRAPSLWKNNTFPEGAENFPVAGVSYSDAEAFCKWLETKINLPVRLPTEAEWEYAARGRENNKYPWGNDWDAKAAASSETGGKVSAVKSFPLNRSSSGAFDMAGNVWEWTADAFQPYPGFVRDSYKEYSEPWFGTHKVLRGGSFATRARLRHPKFRGFYLPDRDDVFCGFRSCSL